MSSSSSSLPSSSISFTPEQEKLVENVQNIVESVLKACRWTTGSSTINEITIDDQTQQITVDGITHAQSPKALGIDISKVHDLQAQLKSMCDWILLAPRRSENLDRASTLLEREGKDNRPFNPNDVANYTCTWPKRVSGHRGSDTTASELWSITLLAQRQDKSQHQNQNQVGMSRRTEWSVEFFLPLDEVAAEAALAVIACGDEGGSNDDHDGDDERDQVVMRVNTFDYEADDESAV